MVLWSRRSFLATATSTIAYVALNRTAGAQNYPSRAVKIIVPSPPGGPQEIALRALTDRLSATLGQPFVIDNIPGGAGGTVGTSAAAKAPSDGYTLLGALPAALVAAPALYANLAYDPGRDFTAIGSVFSSPQVLIVNPALPVHSIGELIAYAKANPGKVNYASAGYGTAPHLLAEMFRQMTGADIVHVPYKGAVGGITDLLGGRIQMAFQVVPLMAQHIQSGQMRALAVTDKRRSLLLPDVPTTAEAGYPDLQAITWFGLLAPAGISREIVSLLNSKINDVLSSAEMEKVLSTFDAVPMPSSPESFGQFIVAERTRWTDVIRKGGIKVE
jgi:tripartite-type tricarboxylate transporter receptor subunit TctC